MPKIAEKYFEKSSRNWFAHVENHFLLAIRLRKYDIARDVILDVFKNPHFDNLTIKASQRWKLLRAYLYYVHHSEELLEIVNFDQFYVSLNVLKEDKKGFNVALMTLEFMHYLCKNQKDKLLDKVERLEKYIYRHLNESDVTYRDKLFFKLMLVIIDTGFDVETAKKRGNKLYEKLKTAEEPGDAYAELEIIPYEDLWEHLMKMMTKELVAV